MFLLFMRTMGTNRIFTFGMKNNVKSQQVVLVTGASSGFGKITAMQLAGRGNIVYGSSRKAMVDTDGVRMLVMDVTDPESVKKAVEGVIAEQGRIDVLVNNAGIGICGALELATPEEIAWQMDTNFMGVVHVCKAVLPFMRKARSGKIVNISSIAGVMAVPYQGFYSASKFAVEGYSEALALEVFPFGIRVCLVEPGDFSTNFTGNRSISKATLADGDYRESFSRTLKIVEDAERGGAHPRKLAAVVCRIVETRRPSFRTKTGPSGQVLFALGKGFLPYGWVQAVLRLFYKIG